ncbi:MarR family winged helix-turn-helix transcriptional regulator [Pseudorhizobium flavum]|uniref:DNA-binding MarR family transcriptional regulator n=1 Tax=Pseudorhizobium flavum TaxID=1335061 RepID=A0A7X0DE23_9HYPH|nr:MarR family transcriptional regulator [Pseudorhizobium flavum]MBB6181533.1 DNA-binding MarR family transcriptional regulator [Pseudorhizobium flavum]CAD6616728.1 MarR family transcriptional regulator [Pseudorhizobium flavum]
MDVSSRRIERVKLGELSGSLGFLLRLAQLRAFEEFFSDRGPRGLKPGEFSVLWVIARNPGIRQSLLGQRLMIKRAHMTKLIRVLEDLGLVSRRTPETDRRAVELTLTAKGRQAVETSSTEFFSYEETTGEPLNDGERTQLISLLQKYVGLREGEAR